MVLYLVVCGFMLGRLLGVCFMELIDMLLDVVGFGVSCDCLCLCLICVGLVVIYFEVGFGCFVSCLLLILADLGVV